MPARIERIPTPELPQFRRALAGRADALYPGARMVDSDVQGPTGVDLLLADDEGRPVFVDVLPNGAGAVPTRVFDHTRWLEENRRLLLRAYTNAGVVRIEDPVFVFVGPRFPASVLAAVGSMSEVPVRLVRAEFFLIDGAAEVLLEDVTPAAAGRISTEVVRRTDDVSPSKSDPLAVIESEAVRALLALFRSGVDGLDGRIAARDQDDRIRFTLGEQRLAEVVVSPGSFTVSPGDGLANPIVVSDRVSLERALNSVVSLFVRDGQAGGGGNGHGGAVELSDDERAVLSEIWSGGGAQGGSD
jgi:hypothetical protein